MLTIYGNAISTCTRRILCVLAEKDAPYEFSSIDFATGEHKKPPFLARQPFGQVPAIDDGGFTMYESRAICRYLDQTRSGTELIPADAKQRAIVEQWISIETSNFTPDAMKIIFQLILGPMSGKAPDMKVVEAARVTLGNTLDIMEKQLATTQFIAGSTFSFADITFLPYIEYLFACGQGDLITSRPATSAWWTRCSTRPSWLKAAGKA